MSGAAATALAIVLPPERIDDAIQVLDDDYDKAQAFAQAALRVQEIAAQVPEGKLESDKDASALERLLSLAKDARKGAEDARKRTVGPLNDQVAAINDLYRPLTTALDELRAKAEPRLLAWIKAKQEVQRKAEQEAQRLRIEAEQRELAARQAAEEARTIEERRTLEAKAAEAMQDAAIATALAPPPIRGIATSDSRHSITRRWRAVVSEPEKLPREFLMPDQKAIDEALSVALRRAKAAGREVPDIEIPGVTLEEVEGLRKGRGI
jgi:hypothetical protein